jgi:DNA-binding IclR family transcriptional regulator
MKGWKILSSHGIVLTYIANHPEVPAVEIASAVGIRERNVRRIIADLVEAGYLEKTRANRCNNYRVNFDARLRHPMFSNIKVSDLLAKMLPLMTVSLALGNDLISHLGS